MGLSVLCRLQLYDSNVEISIVLAALPCPISRGFLPWRLSDAGPLLARRRARDRAGIRNPSQEPLSHRVTPMSVAE
jgi:hypothetical protein